MNEELFDIKTLLNGNDANKVKHSDIPILDSDWTHKNFMVPTSTLPDYISSSRFRTTASNKFTDSSWGGNVGINPRPQFTRYCDPRPNTPFTTKYPTKVENLGLSNTKLGMGRYYSEAIDDNQQVIFMEFGLPKFNSVLDFFLRAVDYQDSILANSGRRSTFYKAGKFIAGMGMLAAFPLVTLAVWTIQSVTKLFTSSSIYSYYYLDNKMWLYWSTVNTITSQLAVELGLLIPEFLPSEPTPPGKVRVGEKVKINQQWVDDLKKLLPEGVIGDKNYIDVFALATRAQTIANKQKESEYEAFKSGISLDGYAKKQHNFMESINNKVLISSNTFDKYLKEVIPIVKKDGYGDNKPTKETAALTEGEKKKIIDNTKELYYKHSKDEDGGYFESVSDYLIGKAGNAASAFDASVRQGGAFAAFYVDYTGVTSESFSNTTGEISTSGTIKQISSRSRSLKFDLGDGNILPGMNDVTNAVKDLANGAVDTVTFGLSSVLTTLLGGAYIELPKRWEDSSISLPTVNYSMQLISPYGNVISQLQNIYIPLCMLLAGTLPLSTGKSSYTSPFLCSLFSKGVQNIKLGMITSLSITRGTSNLGYDINRRPLAIDVSFQVTDFSTLYTAPVNSNVFSGNFLFNQEDDTPLGNYMTVLGGRSLLDNKYALRKLKLKVSKRSAILQQKISGYSLGLAGGNLLENVLGPLVSVNTLIDNKSD